MSPGKAVYAERRLIVIASRKKEVLSQLIGFGWLSALVSRLPIDILKA